MKNSEFEAAFRELAALLQKANLAWVVESVEMDIASGKEVVVREQITTRPSQEEDESGAESKGRRVRATFTASAEYTPAERLRMLITKLRRVAVINPQIAQETLTGLAQGTGDHIALAFPPPSSTAKPVDVSPTGVRDAVSAAEKLDRLLKQLESRAGLNNASN